MSSHSERPDFHHLAFRPASNTGGHDTHDNGDTIESESSKCALVVDSPRGMLTATDMALIPVAEKKGKVFVFLKCTEGPDPASVNAAKKFRRYGFSVGVVSTDASGNSTLNGAKKVIATDHGWSEASTAEAVVDVVRNAWGAEVQSVQDAPTPSDAAFVDYGEEEMPGNKEGSVRTTLGSLYEQLGNSPGQIIQVTPELQNFLNDWYKSAQYQEYDPDPRQSAGSRLAEFERSARDSYRNCWAQHEPDHDLSDPDDCSENE